MDHVAADAIHEVLVAALLDRGPFGTFLGFHLDSQTVRTIGIRPGSLTGFWFPSRTPHRGKIDLVGPHAGVSQLFQKIEPFGCLEGDVVDEMIDARAVGFALDHENENSPKLHGINAVDLDLRSTP